MSDKDKKFSSNKGPKATDVNNPMGNTTNMNNTNNTNNANNMNNTTNTQSPKSGERTSKDCK